MKIAESHLRRLIKETVADISYRGEHTAPDSRDAPLHDLTMNGVYPADVYTHWRKYVSEPSEMSSWSVVILCQGKPNARVKIYRAIPKLLSAQEELDVVRSEKRYILKHGRIPPGVNTSKSRSQYYAELTEKEEQLESIPPAPSTHPATINPGDWVTVDRAYAVEHGDSNLGGKGKYRIISKTVPAKHLFTDGNSIKEWGYSP